MRRVAVVGAGLGGLSACEQLRAGGFDGELVLVGEEEHPPYDRPPLSKDVLRGGPDQRPVHLRPSDEVEELRLDLRLGRRATGLGEGAVLLDDGTEVGFEALVLAVGARPRRLPGTDGVAGVHVLRTHDDAVALAAEVEAAGRLVVVGGGFLGVEAALAARAAGREVLLLEGLAGPLVRVLGPGVAARVRELLETSGVEVRAGTPVEQVRAVDGRVQALVVAGEDVPAPVVLTALGVTPATDWLSGLEREPDGGLRCSATGRTSAPGVWALGDAACWDGVRVEHWTSAMEQAGVVAADVLGAEPPPLGVPYVWSTLWTPGGVRTLQALGAVRPGTEVEVHDSGDGLVALHGEGDRLTGVVLLESKRVVSKARRLLRTGGSLADARAVLLG